jgi:chromosome segregation ATPase
MDKPKCFDELDGVCGQCRYCLIPQRNALLEEVTQLRSEMATLKVKHVETQNQLDTSLMKMSERTCQFSKMKKKLQVLKSDVTSRDSYLRKKKDENEKLQKKFDALRKSAEDMVHAYDYRDESTSVQRERYVAEAINNLRRAVNDG